VLGFQHRLGFLLRAHPEENANDEEHSQENELEDRACHYFAPFTVCFKK